MASILIITPTVPYPVRANGLTIRANPLVQHLAQRHDVHVLAVDDHRADAATYLDELRKLCASADMLAPLSSSFAIRSRLLHALTIRPVPPRRLLNAVTPSTLRTASTIVSHRGCEVVLGHGGMTSQALVALGRRFPTLHRVMDWVDSPSLLTKREVDQEEGDQQGRIDSAVRWERLVNAQVAHGVYISEADAAFGNHGARRNVSVIPNGLVDDFAESVTAEWTAPFSQLPRITLGFLGNMGYQPNHAAAVRLCRHILPAVQARMPNMRVRAKVIGRGPQPELVELAGQDVDVTGAVESIWPAMEEVDVFVFPMTVGAGMQNKVIEALRASRPVIVSPVCAGGIPKVDESGVLVAESTDEIVRQLQLMLSDPDSLRQIVDKGRAFARRLEWGPFLERYEEVLTSK
jgi:glycosyltransferase involved in cell wall biosynthesis